MIYQDSGSAIPDSRVVPASIAGAVTGSIAGAVPGSIAGPVCIPIRGSIPRPAAVLYMV
ncbi:hypothetical protein [Mesorhizobium sp. B2-7-1]|uniref:hypothetical protein n=1 Tax=Mesorhizobium sp. B2-7-1 TaxID=2589909 RepID=UPI0015E2E560|nr:hypothetical protein [Mesorhizobium sp. B2-7-1]